MSRWSAIEARQGVARDRALGVVALAVLLVAGAASQGTARSEAAYSQTRARAARSLNGSATAHLHLVRPEGSMLIEEGPATGALAGSMHADLHTGAVFTGTFTIHTGGGSIDGHGKAVPHGSGRFQSFSGSLLVTGGSGRYAHVSGHAGMYGVFDRRTDSVVIQTTGTLTY
ncbi:MAG TPA: hypothetical protein VK790_01540 [Solirubrobacteraceae bacterium]|jgi:hypothetical protein|nr:hypothetical protein [Solirubrobacteraceae bacterium]